MRRAAPSLPAVPPTLLRNDADARRYVRRTLALTLGVYALLVVALAGWVTPWLIPALLPLAYVRLSLALHELMHVRAPSRVSWFHRLAMIFDTPLGLGYREHRAIHLAHHRHATSARDPELFQIRGSHLAAFANAMISPERAAIAWVKRHGISRALRRQAVARGAIFAVLVAWNPAAFALYWVTLRLCIGTSSFVFHHLLHNAAGTLGDHALPQGLVRVLPVAQALFGAEPVVIVRDHRFHHAHPGVRAGDLPRLYGVPLAVLPATRAAVRLAPATPR
jgi:fatty acid desaturase